MASKKVTHPIIDKEFEGEIGAQMMMEMTGGSTEEISHSVAIRGEPIFTEESLFETTHTLARLLRLIFIKNNITKEVFELLYNKRAMATYSAVNVKGHDKNNMKRSMVAKEITWSLFEKCLNVIGYDIADVMLTLSKREDDNNNLISTVSTIKRSDVLDYKPTNQGYGINLLPRVTSIQEAQDE